VHRERRGCFSVLSVTSQCSLCNLPRSQPFWLFPVLKTRHSTNGESMRIFLAVLFLISAALGQEKLTSQKDRDLYNLLRKDLKAFAGEVTGNAPSELGQARMIVRWLAEHLEWKATDYQQRTVPEIINRGGGNCNELAMVAVAAMKEIDIRMRRVREINIHKETPARGETARAKVKEKGNRLSGLSSPYLPWSILPMPCPWFLSSWD